MFTMRSKIAKDVLGYFFLNPSKSLYINELAKVLDLDAGNLFRKLKEMEQEGILLSETRGQQKYFSLNKKYPLLKEVKKTYEIKYGLPELIKKALSCLVGIDHAYIFGSYAKGNFEDDSDIDVLLVGEHSAIEAQKLISAVQKKTGREINIIDFTPGELKKRQKRNDEFVDNIFSGKVIGLI